MNTATLMNGVFDRLMTMRMETARLRSVARERLDEYWCKRNGKEHFPRGCQRRAEYARAIAANRYISKLILADVVRG